MHQLFVLDVFRKQPIEIELVTACISDVNTVVRNGIHAPIIYGVGFNVKTGELFPATFPDKGPEQSLRTARYLSTSQPVSSDFFHFINFMAFSFNIVFKCIYV